MAKRVSLSGYRLHVKRLHFASEAPTVRTFKFPLVRKCGKKTDFTDVPQELIEAIKHDDLYIRGPSNLVDYLRFKDRKIYTLIDFWIDSLRAGVIFWQDARRLRTDITRIYSVSFLDEYLKEKSPKLFKYFKPADFLNKVVIKRIDLRKQGKKEKLKKLLISLIRDEYKNNNRSEGELGGEDIVVDLEAKNLVDDLTSNLLKNGQFLPEKDRVSYWLTKWNIYVQELKEITEYDFTALIFPEISLDLRVEVNEENVLEILNQILIQRLIWIAKTPGTVKEDTRSLLLKYSDELRKAVAHPNLLSEILNEAWEDIYKEEARNSQRTKNDKKDELEEKVIKKTNSEFKKKIVDPVANALKELLGLSNKASALSNYFNEFLEYLKKSNTELIINYYASLGLPKKKLVEIREKLFWLSEKAKQFHKSAGKPKLSKLLGKGINNWHDLRTVFGGRLESWLTNHIERLAKQYRQIVILKKSLPKIIEFTNKYPDDYRDINPDEINNRKQEIQGLIEEIKAKVGNPSVVQDNLEDYEVLEHLVKALRQRVNEYFQLYFRDDLERRNTKLSQVKELKDFWSCRVYSPRSFYGYAQRKRLRKIIETTIPTIKTGISLTRYFLKTLKELPDYTKATQEKDKRKVREDAGIRRLLEILRSKYKDKKLNSDKFKDFYRELLLRYATGKDLASNSKTFYRSEYSTSTQQEIELTVSDYAREVEKIVTEITEFVLSVTDKELLNDAFLLLDWIETARLVVARFFRWMDQEKEWDVTKFRLSTFPAANKFIGRLKNKQVKTPMFRFIIMSFVFSEFRGAATVFSKKYLISKWNVQVVGSDKKFKLALAPKNQDVDIERMYQLIVRRRPEVLKNIRWQVIIYTKQGNSQQLITLKNKSGSFSLSKEKINDTNLLQICTSKYHLQFLERLIYQPQNWQDIEIKISEPSLIVEEVDEILGWDLNSGRPELKKLEKNRPILYYALPMQFAVKRAENTITQLQKIKQAKPEDVYYLGADIGEYGIAWAVIKIENGQVVIRDYGFEYDKQIRKIQDKFNEVQQKARQGVFLEASTALAELRENAIGYLRNKLHNKLIDYGAQIIYEANISGFEVGVGRVTKIYDSVKRADVGNHPDVSTKIYKSLIKHIWGLEAPRAKGDRMRDKSPGWQVGAAGTSYTCICCGQSIYQLGNNKKNKLKEDKDKKDKDKWMLLDSLVGKSNIYQFKHPKKESIVLGYSSAKSLDSGIEYKKVKGYVRNFARPPVGVLEEVEYIDKKTGGKKKKLTFEVDSETTKRFILDKGILTKSRLKSLRLKRGNSAIFVCPFEGCHAVVDADVQAAVVIALRGYLYMKEFYENKNEEPFKDSKDKLNNLTQKLLKNFQLKGKLEFVYYKGDNAKD